MNDTALSRVGMPRTRPSDPRFSSGPCRKHPGWDLTALSTNTLGRSHRASQPKARLKLAIDRTASLLGLPEDWRLGIVPGSDTGAFEMALWSLLGSQPVDALVWDSFSADWAKDLSELELPNLNILQADAGELPAFEQVQSGHDVVFVYNGTTTGTRVPDLDWLPEKLEGKLGEEQDNLVLCDATSAAFAMALDFSKLDVVTWSWQKCLGGEAAHGMLALSPAAVARLEKNTPRPLPKLFSLTKNNQLIEGIFKGATINTPSMLAVEDYHSALDWADSIGGLSALHQRSEQNLATLATWVEKNAWIDWLPKASTHRSQTSMCLRIVDPVFTALPADEQQEAINQMVARLADEGVAFDIANYRSAPPGFRIWGGPTVESTDIDTLTLWLDWTYQTFLHDRKTGALSHG